jgi:hypothetical protein
MQPFSLLRDCLLLLPKEPSNSHHGLDADCDPQTSLETSTRCRKERTRYGSTQQQHSSKEATIPVWVLTKGRSEELRIAHKIAVQTRQDYGWHCVVLQRATGNNLSSALERQDGDCSKVGCGKAAWQCEPYELGAILLHNDRRLVRDDWDRGNDGDNSNENRLDGERRDQHPSFLGTEESVEG